MLYLPQPSGPRHSLPARLITALGLLCFPLVGSSCHSLASGDQAHVGTIVAPHERHASYEIREYRLEPRSPGDGQHRLKVALYNQNPAPVAWLYFWDAERCRPDIHWNREADLERCPRCHPQYELHFLMKEWPKMRQILGQTNSPAKLIFRADQWRIER